MKRRNTLQASLVAAIGILSFAMASATPLAEVKRTIIIKGLDEAYPEIIVTYHSKKEEKKEEKKIVYTRDGEFHIGIPDDEELEGVTILDKYIPIGESAETADGAVIVTTTTTRHPDGSITILTTITQP